MLPHPTPRNPAPVPAGAQPLVLLLLPPLALLYRQLQVWGAGRVPLLCTALRMRTLAACLSCDLPRLRTARQVSCLLLAAAWCRLPPCCSPG